MSPVTSALLLSPVRVTPLSASGSRRSWRQRPRGLVVVRDHDDEDILPIFTGRIAPPPDPESLPKGPQMGGKTLGEELALLREAYNKDEADQEARLHEHLYSDNWQGDVYVGSNMNMLSLIVGLTILVPVLGLLFAYLSYGVLWTGHYY